MRLKTSRSQHQQMVSHCLDSIKLKPFIDDFLGGAPPSRDTQQVDESVHKQHDVELRQMFSLFRKYKLTVEKTKMHLFVQEVKVCGHILCNGQRMSTHQNGAGRT